MILGNKIKHYTQFNSSIRNGCVTLLLTISTVAIEEESLKSSQFGNINNNDWYVFRLTLTYTFGENHVTVLKQ
jgi:hypothetical protein